MSCIISPFLCSDIYENVMDSTCSYEWHFHLPLKSRCLDVTRLSRDSKIRRDSGFKSWERSYFRWKRAMGLSSPEKRSQIPWCNVSHADRCFRYKKNLQRPCLNLQVNGASVARWSLKPGDGNEGPMASNTSRRIGLKVSSTPRGERDISVSKGEEKKSQIYQPQTNSPHGEVEQADIFRSQGQ